MIFLKSILAVYVSLYLILPGCLCQILFVLGDVDAVHSSVELDRSLEVNPLDETVMMTCFCDDLVEKTAEVHPNEVIEASPIALLNRPVWAPFSLFKDSNRDYSNGSRAPPGTPRWAIASHSGVFLI